MKSTKVLWFWGLGLLGSLGTAACGGITQPLGDVAGAPSTGGTSDHESAGSGGRSGNGSAAPHGCETRCFEKVLTGSAASCKLCHTSNTNDVGGLQSSGLDLQSPNITARLKDVPAKHLDLPYGKNLCPTGDLLVDSSRPQDSWLLKKVKGQQGTCGEPMPITGTLRLDEFVCIEAYVYCVAGQAPPGP
ncbi:MAG TPA: hypothetical protein VJN18_25535 [Polyangiaceae bacterium]|nr:hypothetical protein [Polyangiaceae bacterium]